MAIETPLESSSSSNGKVEQQQLQWWRSSIIDPNNNICRNTDTLKYPNISVAQYMAEKFAKLDPNLIALIDPNTGESITFDKFQHRVHAFAQGLLRIVGHRDQSASAITATDVVLFYADNSIEYVVAQFAVIYLGLTYCPVRPACGPFEVSHRLRDASITVLMFGTKKAGSLLKLLNNEQYCDSVQNLKLLVQIDDGGNGDDLVKQHSLQQHSLLKDKPFYSFEQIHHLGNGIGDHLDTVPHFPIDNNEEKIFLISYTSGTTGPSKGAIHSNRTFLAWLVHMRIPAKYTGQRLLTPMPLGHIAGTIFIPQALLSGMTVILTNAGEPDTIMPLIERYRVNHYLFGLNAVSDLVHKPYPEQYDLSSLRVFRFGGTKTSSKQLVTIQRKYGVKMLEIYGATECMGHVLIPWSSIERDDVDFEPGNVGIVQPNIEMKIVHLQTGTPVGVNQRGEICFRGPPCFVRYLHSDDATRETIDTDGWYHTGDVGYYDHRGCLFITDRIKELIKYSVWSVAPAEIEECLYQHPAVGAVCVVGVPHRTDGSHVRAYVQPRQQQQQQQRPSGLGPGPESESESSTPEITEQELIDFVAENMGTHNQLCGGVRFVAHMPRTAVGKVDRQYFHRLAQQELIN